MHSMKILASFQINNFLAVCNHVKLPPIQRLGLVLDEFPQGNETEVFNVVLSLQSLIGHLNDSEVINIISLLKNCSSLMDLSISISNITVIGMKDLAKLLPILPSLKTLDLCSHTIAVGDEGTVTHPALQNVDCTVNTCVMGENLGVVPGVLNNLEGIINIHMSCNQF